MSGQSATCTLAEIAKRSKDVQIFPKPTGSGTSPECHPPSSKKP